VQKELLWTQDLPVVALVASWISVSKLEVPISMKSKSTPCGLLSCHTSTPAAVWGATFRCSLNVSGHTQFCSPPSALPSTVSLGWSARLPTPNAKYTRGGKWGLATAKSGRAQKKWPFCVFAPINLHLLLALEGHEQLHRGNKGSVRCDVLHAYVCDQAEPPPDSHQADTAYDLIHVPNRHSGLQGGLFM
jgi:hypothetical protein